MANTKNQRVLEALRPLKASLQQERDALLARSEPLHRRREEILARLQPLEAELRDVDVQISEIEVPALRDLGNELAAIARQEGAITMFNGEEKGDEA